MTLQAIADTYAGEYCTLNGEPAVIAGRIQAHAKILQLPCGQSVEFSWPTVKRIMDEKSGRFTA